VKAFDTEWFIKLKP